MFERELEIASAAALEAGKVILQVYETAFAVDHKSPSDPVTEADRRANALIVETLQRAFPDDGIVAEESVDQASVGTTGRCWYVDPLDGTKEFVSRNGEFSVMIGLSINGSAALGVVFQPVGAKLYTGLAAGGAWLSVDGQRSALQVSNTAAAADLRLVVSRSHRSSDTDGLARSLGITKERASGSVGLKVGLIAEQKADLYVHLSDKASIWDVCAPEAILRGAGGRFTDLEGKAFTYGEWVKNKGGILACNSAAYDAVLPAVRALAKRTLLRTV